MDIPRSLQPQPASPLELAKREYHAATIAMGELDAKVIDAAATLDELKQAYGASIVRVNAARDKLVEARTPAPAAEAVAHPDIDFLDAIDLDLNGKSRDFALDRVTEADQQRLAEIVRKASPHSHRAELILAFLAGAVATGGEVKALDPPALVGAN